MIKPAIPIATIMMRNAINPPKTENAGPVEPLTIRVAEASIIKTIIATTLIMATMGIITLIRLA